MTNITKEPRLRSRACVQRKFTRLTPHVYLSRHYAVQIPGHSEAPAPKERNAGQGAFREQGRARWPAVFFRLCPSGYCPSKEYSLKPCKYRRNELPQWNPLEKEKHGWNINGPICVIQDNGRARPATEVYKNPPQAAPLSSSDLRLQTSDPAPMTHRLPPLS